MPGRYLSASFIALCSPCPRYTLLLFFSSLYFMFYTRAGKPIVSFNRRRTSWDAATGLALWQWGSMYIDVELSIRRAGIITVRFLVPVDQDLESDVQQGQGYATNVDIDERQVHRWRRRKKKFPDTVRPGGSLRKTDLMGESTRFAGVGGERRGVWF